jgi:hypothetical protein
VSKNNTASETCTYSGTRNGPRPIGMSNSHKAQIATADQPGTYRETISTGPFGHQAAKMNHPKYKPAIK